MTFGGTEIGLPFGKLYLLRHALELSFTDSRKVLAVRCRSGFLVEEYRQVITFCHFHTHFLRERNGLFHGHILDWDKRNNVHSAHTGMLPLVFVQVDELYGHTDGFEHGIAERFGLAHYGNYQPVVVFIVTVIQQLHTLFATERGYNTVYFLQVTSLAEIGDTFYDSVHNGYVFGAYYRGDGIFL